MAITYTSRAGDTLDWICWRFYHGRQSGAVEAVLDVNPHLADSGPILSGGQVLVLPELPVAEEPPPLALWD